MQPVVSPRRTRMSPPAQTTTHRDVLKSGRTPGRRLPVGAEVLPEGKGVHFRVWSPKCRRIEVVIAASPGGTAERCTKLQPEGNGYHSGIVEQVTAPMLYGLRCDGGQPVWP